MKRRNVLKKLFAASALAGAATPLEAQRTGNAPIQLHTDLHVKLEEELQLLADFHNLFLPRIRKAPGFIDARLLKFKQANVGKAHPHFNYRLVQIFESEQLREAWTKAEGHKVAWHKAIEPHVKVPFDAFLYEIVAENKKTRS